MNDEDALVDIKSRFYFSYRRGFPKLEGTIAMISDMGWGCTHRSAQMLVCCALIRWRLGRNARLRTSSPSNVPREAREVLALFADTPTAPLSLHALSSAATRMLSSGDAKKKPGDWLGPSTVSVAIRAVINARQPWGVRCYIAQDAVIYRDALPVEGAVLIMVPLRLGLTQLNESYIPLLQASLRCPLSVGIIGGQNSASHYFLGYTQNDVLFLDPHTPQAAVAELSDPLSSCPLDSYVASSPALMPFSSVDPSLAIGFFCANSDEIEQLRKYLDVETSHLPFSLSVQDSCDFAPSPSTPVAASVAADTDDWELI